MEDNINPFDQEFDKSDVIGIDTKADKEPLLTLEDLELYDEEKFLNQKFKNIVDDPNVKKISTLPEDLKELIDDSQFQNYEQYEKLTDEDILQKNFKDFLILKKISGKLEGLSGKNRIPRYKIQEAKNLIIEDDPIVTDFDEERKSKTTVITHKNELDEIEYIEVLCECGSKTIIKFDYDTKMETYSPASFNKEDYNPDETIYAYDIPVEELSNEENDDNESKDLIESDEQLIESDEQIDDNIQESIVDQQENKSDIDDTQVSNNNIKDNNIEKDQ